MQYNLQIKSTWISNTLIKTSWNVKFLPSIEMFAVLYLFEDDDLCPLAGEVYSL